MNIMRQTTIAGLGLVLISACATSVSGGVTPKDLNDQITVLKGTAVTDSNSASIIADLTEKLATAETQVSGSTASPELNLAWMFTAMNAAETLTGIPGQSPEAIASAAGKTLNYADSISTSCLDMAASGIDSRQGNFCGVALAIRRLNDSTQAIQAFSSSSQQGDWASSAAASAGFETQVSTNWAAYADDASQLALSEQNQTPFEVMALRKTCEFQAAQSSVNLLGSASMEDSVLGAQDAYWSAVSSAAGFLDISSGASVCESEPDGIACQRETEIKVAEICGAL